MARFNKQYERSSFLVESFEEFYKEVLKNKKFVLSSPWKQNTEEANSSPTAIAEYILTRLQTFLEEQSLTANYGGSSFVETYYAEAQFIMVALADEVFLSMDWPGKKYWESNLLEQRLYDTHSAGQVFFDKLDDLLERKDPVRTDLAILYLNALGLGFQGKYRKLNNIEEQDEYRRKLFVFINRRDPYLFQKKTHLMPDAYAHTLEGNTPKDLPNLKNWYMVFGGLALTYLLISYIIWYAATYDVMQVVNQIIASNTLGK